MVSLSTDQIRHVIRDHKSGRYLGDGGDWKENWEEARTFADPTSAMRLCLRHGWTGSELVTLFGDGSMARSALFA